jgi:hypothetical protein
MTFPKCLNSEGCLILRLNILKRHLKITSELVLCIGKVVSKVVAGTSLFRRSEVVKKGVILKFSVLPDTDSLYVVVILPAVEGRQRLPSSQYLVHKIHQFLVFLMYRAHDVA